MSTRPPASCWPLWNGASARWTRSTRDFAAAAVGNFASGWTWLVSGTDGLQIVNTDDADTPLRHGQRALLTIDVWEHAYYLDYQNARAAYVDAFIEHLINWEFASTNFAQT